MKQTWNSLNTKFETKERNETEGDEIYNETLKLNEINCMKIEMNIEIHNDASKLSEIKIEICNNTLKLSEINCVKSEIKINIGMY